MSLLDKIEELQNKPEGYRKKVLAVLMVLIMSTVILIWISTVNLSMDKTGENIKKSGAEYAPFNTLKESAINIKESFGEAVSRFKDDGEDDGGKEETTKKESIESESGGAGEEEVTIIEEIKTPPATE